MGRAGKRTRGVGVRTVAVPARGTLPAYALRISPRARRIRLSVSARLGLVVTVPPGISADAVAAIVRDKAAWVERSLARVAEHRALHEAGAEALLPDAIDLAAFGESLAVDYRHTSSATVRAERVGGAVRVSGAVDDADACLAALQRWATREAGARLLPMLEHLAEETRLHPSSVAVRRQRTRWGSCSAKGRVALNRNLVFLPPELVRAVMLHELVHLRVLDHSPRFWAALSEFDPDARAHRAALRDAGRLVPPWADA